MNEKRLARALQAECGIRYTRALAFVRQFREKIFNMTVTDDGVAWKEQPDAACSLWRSLYGEGT